MRSAYCGSTHFALYRMIFLLLEISRAVHTICSTTSLVNCQRRLCRGWKKSDLAFAAEAYRRAVGYFQNVALPSVLVELARVHAAAGSAASAARICAWVIESFPAARATTAAVLLAAASMCRLRMHAQAAVYVQYVAWAEVAPPPFAENSLTMVLIRVHSAAVCRSRPRHCA
jgi:hypothetical protein